MFFISGIFEAVGTVLPGISSTAILMLLGVYDIYLLSIANVFKLSLLVNTLNFLIPFTTGFVVGVVLLSILVNYLFARHKSLTFSVILGISLSSVFLLLLKILSQVTFFLEIPLLLILMLVGFLVTNKI